MSNKPGACLGKTNGNRWTNGTNTFKNLSSWSPDVATNLQVNVIDFPYVQSSITLGKMICPPFINSVALASNFPSEPKLAISCVHLERSASA